MDGQRFDEFTRWLTASSGISRRLLLKVFGGGIGGGVAVVAGRGARATVATCEDDDGCATGICCYGECREASCCIEDYDQSPHCGPGSICTENGCYDPGCGDDSECPGEEICCGGSCLPLECCVPDGQYDSRCPSGYVCEGGYCVEPTSGCSSDEECDGVCCEGSCVRGECCAHPDSRCPAGTSCVDYSCEATYCGNSAEACPSGWLCCSQYCQDLECCSSDLDADEQCPSGYECVENYCVEAGCKSDKDCPVGICCGGVCTAGVAEYECCLEDEDPNERCPKGTSCFEGICDPIQVEGNCCAALSAGLDCAPNECCTQTASPSDYCPDGSTCEPTGYRREGVCCVEEGQRCLTGTPCCGGVQCVNGYCGGSNEPGPQPTATKATPPELDKWALWSGDNWRLAGATIYLRRLTAEDDPDVMGDEVVGPTYSQDDLDRLAKLGANYVEISHPAPYGETAPYKLDVEVRDYLDDLIELAGEADLFVVISLRTGPGRSEVVPRGFPVCKAGGCFSGGPGEADALRIQSRLWRDEDAQDAWVDLWEATARRYKDSPEVIGYHLLAMPDAPDVKTYREFVERLVKAIRAVDKETPILIDAPDKGSPEDLEDIEPLDDKYIVYRVGTFAPARYLYQPSDADDPLTYGEAFDPTADDEDGDFDRDWLEDWLDPAVDWAKENKRPVAIGGYGIPRWQPGLEDYLDDLLELIDEAEWRATLWLWSPEKGPTEDDAFNLEHGPDPDNHKIRDNPLIDVVKKYWKGIEVRLSTFEEGGD